MSTTKKPLPPLTDLLGEVLKHKYFDGVLKVDFQKRMPTSPLFVITGPNASGKSFVSKLIDQYARHEYDIEVMNVGMGFRTRQGIARSLVFGDEGDSSTGLNSYSAVRGGLSTCEQRTTPHMLILDEPDIGLSESFQGGLGLLLAQFARKMPQHTYGLGIVTHSRRLLAHLDPLRPHHLRCGDELLLRQVIAREPKDLAPHEIEAAQARGTAQRRAIQKVIDELKAERQENL